MKLLLIATTILFLASCSSELELNDKEAWKKLKDNDQIVAEAFMLSCYQNKSIVKWRISNVDQTVQYDIPVGFLTRETTRRKIVTKIFEEAYTNKQVNDYYWNYMVEKVIGPEKIERYRVK